MSVTFTPNVPPGTELLRRGYLRIQDINNGLVTMFGAPLTGALTFGAPFSFFDAAAQTAGRLSVITPVNDGEIVPKGYADQKVTVSTDLNSSDGGNTYTGTATPAFTAPVTNALYLVTNVGPPNVGAVTIQLSNDPTFYPLIHLDGSALIAGELATGQALLDFDGTSFRLISSSLTKDFVNSVVNPPLGRSAMATGTVSPLLQAGTDVITSAPIVIPADGTYNVYAEFMCYVTVLVPQEVESTTYFWIVDDQGTPNTWAFASQSFRNGTNGNGGAHFIIAGSGFSPVAYPASTTLNLKVQGAQLTVAGVTATALQTPSSGIGTQNWTGTFPSTWPASYMGVTLFRTH